MLLVLLALTSLASAACPKVIATEKVESSSEMAIRAFLAEDVSTVRAAVSQMETELGCVAVPFTPHQAALVHQARGVASEASGDERAATAAIASALAVDRDSLHPLIEPLVDRALALGDPTDEPFGTSLGAVTYVDGQVSASRVVGRPAIVQSFTLSGDLIGTVLLSAGEPLPEWVAFPPFECDEQTSADDLVAGTLEAERAFSKLDVAGFEAALQAAADGLPCTQGQIHMREAAAIHRLEGIRLFVARNKSSAIRSFQAAHSLDPGQASEVLLTKGSDMAALWERARTQTSSPWIAIDVPDGVHLIVDGLRARERPAALPSIVQVSTPSGVILWTRYIPEGGKLPALEGFTAESARVERDLLPPGSAMYLDHQERRSLRTKRGILVVSSAMALAGSAGLYFGNSVASQTYLHPATPVDERNRYRRIANANGVGSMALFFTGTGLGLGAVLIR